MFETLYALEDDASVKQHLPALIVTDSHWRRGLSVGHGESQRSHEGCSVKLKIKDYNWIRLVPPPLVTSLDGQGRFCHLCHSQ